MFPWPLSGRPGPLVSGSGLSLAGGYMHWEQPHLLCFSTSATKEEPSLHSKVYFLRLRRSPAQQPGPGHDPRHSTQETGRVVWQMA